MFIFIDESGTFTHTSTPNSWSVVGALVVPEISKRKLEQHLLNLKMSLGLKHSDEAKLKNLDEVQYTEFLSGLRKIDCLLFISAIDLSSQDQNKVLSHQNTQVESILKNRPKMLHKEGRELIDQLAHRVKSLSPQLYIQFVTQIDILDQVYRRSTLYYSQRVPSTLSSFRWRSDEKNSTRPLFEETVRYMAAPLLQAKSLDDPTIFVEEFDYSHFERFAYLPDEIPAYIQEQTGREINSGANLGKVLSDFKFVSSHEFPGIQTIDLLTSGFRRVLRNEFQESLKICELLGALTLQKNKPNPPIHLISLAADETRVMGHAESVARCCIASCKPMILN